MRASVLGVAFLLLSGCVVYERRPYAPPPAAAAPARRVLTREQAVDVAFRLCQDRDLRVDRVERARLDADGRWHVTLAGYLDRAQMLLDGRDGKLLKGRFRRGGEQAPAAPSPGEQPAEPGDELD